MPFTNDGRVTRSSIDLGSWQSTQETGCASPACAASATCVVGGLVSTCIRAGVVVYPPADRTVGLDSLKRFKEDAREVREGFECGIKISGYDDIKVGDVIEAFRVDQVQRTL